MIKYDIKSEQMLYYITIVGTNLFYMDNKIITIAPSNITEEEIYEMHRLLLEQRRN